MRIIKLGLISAIVLFGIITLIASFIPSGVRVSRAIDINAPREKVYPQLAETKEWGNWNEYIRSYTGRQVQGPQLVTNEMTIALAEKDDSIITTVWRQPSGVTFNSGYRLVETDTYHCTVQWYFDFHLKWYPWEKLQSIMYDGQFGPVMEKSLANLKRSLENSQ